MDMMTDVCRLCLNNSQVIWNVYEYDIQELPTKILRCTTVEMSEDDGLPNGACANCIRLVLQFDVFRERCQYSDFVLRKKYLTGKFKLDSATQNHNNGFVQVNNAIISPSAAVTEIVKEALLNDGIVAHHTKLKSENCSGSYNKGEGCNNVDCKLSSHADRLLDIANDDLTVPTSVKDNVNQRKKCKIKKKKDESKQEKNNFRHNLVHTEQHYAIMGQERKVRIYEMDDSMRQIIGHNIYICEICLTEFRSFFEYHDHQNTHNGELVFSCTKCSKIFTSRQDLLAHDSRHKIACKICELEVLPKSMSAHLLIHTDVHKCAECGMRHTSNASLEKHIKARHTGIKGFVCHICGKQSSCQSSMNRHMAYHSSERPYKCKFCDFCAKSLNIVQVHTSRKHFAEKCVCEVCAKLFKSQPSLIQHMKRIHTARKHVCDICGKTFIERYNLNRHLKKHAGQRLHECKICSKEFFTIRKLKEHMHSHRQGCVSCPKCGKEFFYKKYYTKHVLKCTQAGECNSILDNSNNCCSVSPNFR